MEFHFEKQKQVGPSLVVVAAAAVFASVKFLAAKPLRWVKKLLLPPPLWARRMLPGQRLAPRCAAGLARAIRCAQQYLKSGLLRACWRRWGRPSQQACGQQHPLQAAKHTRRDMNSKQVTARMHVRTATAKAHLAAQTTSRQAQGDGGLWKGNVAPRSGSSGCIPLAQAQHAASDPVAHTPAHHTQQQM
jgi:hypothetical protein